MADLRGRNENAAVTTREPTFSAGREYLEGRRCDADPEAPCMIALFGPAQSASSMRIGTGARGRSSARWQRWILNGEVDRSSSRASR
jgi:hypothetical protein